jgi:predicted nucleotidyltransferase
MDETLLTPREQQVLEAFLSRTRRLSEATRIAAVVLFGSRARGDSHQDSDLDVAVFCDGSRDRPLERQILDAAIEVMDELDALEIKLRPVALFAGQSAHTTRLRHSIQREGIPLWERR